MRCVLLAFAAGIAAIQTLAVLPTPTSCAVLAMTALMLICLLIRFPVVRDAIPASGKFAHLLDFFVLPRARISLCMICAASIGFLWAAFCAHDRLHDRLLPEWEGRDITLIGTVADFPTSSVRGSRFLFAVERAMSQNGVTPRVPARLSLSWYAGRNGNVVPEIAP